MTISGNGKPRWVHGWFAIKRESVPDNRLRLTVVPIGYTPAGEPKCYTNGLALRFVPVDEPLPQLRG